MKYSHATCVVAILSWGTNFNTKGTCADVPDVTTATEPQTDISLLMCVISWSGTQGALYGVTMVTGFVTFNTLCYIVLSFDSVKGKGGYSEIELGTLNGKTYSDFNFIS